MLAALAKYQIIPTLNIKDIAPDTALKVCEALIKGGLPVMEIQFRRHSDSLAIKEITRVFPDFLIGAGGIFNSGQLLRAAECKVKFASAPGVCPDTIATAVKQKIAFMPGVVTPTEIQTVLINGFADFQFFPAQKLGGIDYLKAILGPFEHLPLGVFPKGDISPEQAVEYLKIQHVAAVELDNILTEELICSEKWDKISDAAHKTIDYINSR